MTTKTTAEKNFYETWVDSQKKMIDNMTDAASKFTTDKVLNETLEKGSGLYKNWLDSQLTYVNEQTGQLKETHSNMTPEQLTAATKAWMDNQMKMTKEFMEFSMNTMKNYMENSIKSYPVLNGNAEKIRSTFDQNLNLFKQWNDTLNTSYNEMMKNFNPGTVKNAMGGMINMTDSYSKFVELWMPFFNTLQEKTFNADMFKNLMNQTAFKEMFDKMFNYNSNPMSNLMNSWNMSNFSTNDWMKNWNNMFNPSSNPWNQSMAEWMNNFSGNTNPFSNFMNMSKMYNWSANPMNDLMKNWTNMYNQNQNNWSNMFQTPQAGGFFNSMMNNYNAIHESTQQAFAPMFRLMTPNAGTEQAEAVKNITNKLSQFNIRFGEMQYITYTTGLKAMQKVAERMQEKFAKGEEFKGLNSLYTDWLNTCDKVFVELFETDEYAKVQAEVAALQHSIRKDSESIMENMMANVPVVTRSEMDENYKTIYELRKKVTELERALESREDAAPKAAKKPVK